MLKSDLFDYNDGYVFGKVIIDVLATAAIENNEAHKDITFKNSASFRTCI